jgi:hypothetical protein
MPKQPSVFVQYVLNNKFQIGDQRCLNLARDAWSPLVEEGEIESLGRYETDLERTV